MRAKITETIALGVSLVVLWPAAAGADAVITWNENAAKAAKFSNGA